MNVFSLDNQAQDPSERFYAQLRDNHINDSSDLVPSKCQIKSNEIERHMVSRENMNIRWKYLFFSRRINHFTWEGKHSVVNVCELLENWKPYSR